MNRCRDCKHFDVRDLGAQWSHGFGACRGIPDNDTRAPFATVVDYEGYSATLKVKPDFGCVLWAGQGEMVDVPMEEVRADCKQLGQAGDES